MNAAELCTLVLDTRPVIHTGRELAAREGVNERTFTSRFVRAGAPTPKDITRRSTAVLLAEELEDGATLVGAAARLNFSSPQHVSRFIRETCRTTREAMSTGAAARRAEFVHWLTVTHGAAIDRALTTQALTKATT